MPAVMYRPKELVTVDAPIEVMQGKHLEFEADPLIHVGFLGSESDLRTVRRLLLANPSITLKALENRLNELSFLGPFTVVLVTRGSYGKELGYYVLKPQSRPAAGRMITLPGPTAYQKFISPGIGPELCYTRMVRNEPIRLSANYIMALAVSQLTNGISTTKVRVGMISPETKKDVIVNLPVEDLVFEYNLLTRFVEQPA